MTMLAALGLCACDASDSDAACTTDVKSIVVAVEDADGEPVSGASVTSTHVDSGRRQSPGLVGDGSFYFLDDGGGTFRYDAIDDGRSASVDVVWRCDECHCLPAESPVTIVLP